MTTWLRPLDFKTYLQLYWLKGDRGRYNSPFPFPKDVRKSRWHRGARTSTTRPLHEDPLAEAGGRPLRGQQVGRTSLAKIAPMRVLVGLSRLRGYGTGTAGAGGHTSHTWKRRGAVAPPGGEGSDNLAAIANAPAQEFDDMQFSIMRPGETAGDNRYIPQEAAHNRAAGMSGDALERRVSRQYAPEHSLADVQNKTETKVATAQPKRLAPKRLTGRGGRPSEREFDLIMRRIGQKNIPAEREHLWAGAIDPEDPSIDHEIERGPVAPGDEEWAPNDTWLRNRLRNDPNATLQKEIEWPSSFVTNPAAYQADAKRRQLWNNARNPEDLGYADPDAGEWDKLRRLISVNAGLSNPHNPLQAIAEAIERFKLNQSREEHEVSLPAPWTGFAEPVFRNLRNQWYNNGPGRYYIEFGKRTAGGSTRSMVTQNPVPPYVRRGGNPRAWSPETRNLGQAYDVEKGKHRFVNLDAVRKIVPLDGQDDIEYRPWEGSNTTIPRSEREYTSSPNRWYPKGHGPDDEPAQPMSKYRGQTGLENFRNWLRGRGQQFADRVPGGGGEAATGRKAGTFAPRGWLSSVLRQRPDLAQSITPDSMQPGPVTPGPSLPRWTRPSASRGSAGGRPLGFGDGQDEAPGQGTVRKPAPQPTPEQPRTGLLGKLLNGLLGYPPDLPFSDAVSDYTYGYRGGPSMLRRLPSSRRPTRTWSPPAGQSALDPPRMKRDDYLDLSGLFPQPAEEPTVMLPPRRVAKRDMLDLSGLDFAAEDDELPGTQKLPAQKLLHLLSSLAAQRPFRVNQDTSREEALDMFRGLPSGMIRPGGEGSTPQDIGGAGQYPEYPLLKKLKSRRALAGVATQPPAYRMDQLPAQPRNVPGIIGPRQEAQVAQMLAGMERTKAPYAEMQPQQKRLDRYTARRQSEVASQLPAGQPQSVNDVMLPLLAERGQMRGGKGLVNPMQQTQRRLVSRHGATVPAFGREAAGSNAPLTPMQISARRQNIDRLLAAERSGQGIRNIPYAFANDEDRPAFAGSGLGVSTPAHMIKPPQPGNISQQLRATGRGLTSSTNPTPLAPTPPEATAQAKPALPLARTLPATRAPQARRLGSPWAQANTYLNRASRAGVPAADRLKNSARMINQGTMRTHTPLDVLLDLFRGLKLNRMNKRAGFDEMDFGLAQNEPGDEAAGLRHWLRESNDFDPYPHASNKRLTHYLNRGVTNWDPQQRLDYERWAVDSANPVHRGMGGPLHHAMIRAEARLRRPGIPPMLRGGQSFSAGASDPRGLSHLNPIIRKRRLANC